jgi:hypothetical protein
MKSARGVGTVGVVSVVAQPINAATTPACGNQRQGLREFLILPCSIERIVILQVFSTSLIAWKWMRRN